MNEATNILIKEENKEQKPFVNLFNKCAFDLSDDDISLVKGYLSSWNDSRKLVFEIEENKKKIEKEFNDLKTQQNKISNLMLKQMDYLTDATLIVLKKIASPDYIKYLTENRENLNINLQDKKLAIEVIEIPTQIK